MNLKLLRHATLGLEYGGVTFLIDPMFSEAGVNPPIMNTPNELRNPLVPLPATAQEWLHPDAAIVTHLHPDHWDAAAQEAMAKSTPILCQPGDESAFYSSGFQSVLPVADHARYKGVTLTRTGGRHGTGEIGARMGNVSGFVLKAEGEPTLYLAGDTIWCDEVVEALNTHKPDVIIVNAGGARFNVGDPITMGGDDVVQVCRYAPGSKVIPVHMDAINHCLVTRAQLRERLEAEALLHQVLILEDGEAVRL
ncbi:MBL fold metallo-hydrolase [Paenibacillus rigui]|uniref:Metallo-beta-lactamase domain-containing protein n=1 Tax=Paenibacillus rigui TaxID=554312 RepID=A0A229UJV2_9BACL|nr:MBL fold metallo-hydrolase [Paenibacillus rigui]OXM83728.1 hypothetical protein CF651_24360 [Paenibacillus rigui]